MVSSAKTVWGPRWSCCCYAELLSPLESDTCHTKIKRGECSLGGLSESHDFSCRVWVSLMGFGLGAVVCSAMLPPP